MPITLDQLRQKRDAVRASFSRFEDMRPGSLSERYVKCGKPGCHCQKPDAQGHGPFLLLTYKQNGKTVTRTVPADMAEVIRRQVKMFGDFRKTVKEFIDVNGQLCEAQLQERKAGKLTGAEKKGSKRATRRHSARKSTPS